MKRDEGYTYLSVLVIVFALTVAGQVTWMPTPTVTKRDMERELMFRGLAYRDAIASYVAMGDGERRFPGRLDDLLHDPRDPTRRHLRKLYSDPTTGSNWAVIRSPLGGISGVYPMGSDRPMQRANFPVGLDGFASAETYSGWRFVVADPVNPE